MPVERVVTSAAVKCVITSTTNKRVVSSIAIQSLIRGGVDAKSGALILEAVVFWMINKYSFEEVKLTRVWLA